MIIKELIAFLQAQPDHEIEIFVQNGNKALPIAMARKSFIFSNAKVINTNSSAYMHDEWQIITEYKPVSDRKAKDVLLLVDALDAA